MLATVLVGAGACDSGGGGGDGDRVAKSTEASSSASPPALSPPALLPAPPPPASGAAASASTSAPLARASACGTDMVLVAGNYCPEVEHRCLQHSKEYEEEQERRERAKAKNLPLRESRVSERCLRYEEPGKCLAPGRTPMRFCLDKLEWPNRAGEKPAFVVTYTEAERHCSGAGKRLCTESEFNFACEGESLWPYSYGFVRDAERCNIDRPYVTPRRAMLPHDECEKLPSCREQLRELDKRAPSGAHPQCTSPFGALDLNGNVNEWVFLPGKQSLWRSGLKGGWWGPSRSRCRPTVTAHNEHYAGYEVGFRCCRDLR